MKNVKYTKNTGASTSHKVWSFIALVGLFACGLMVGIGAPKNTPRKMIFTSEQCASLSNKISWGINNSNWDSLEKTQKIFARNCAGFIPQPAPEKKVIEPKPVKDLSPCERVEQILSKRLSSDTSSSIDDLAYNAYTYSQLSVQGCPENIEKWQKLYNDTIAVGYGVDKEYFVLSLNRLSDSNPVKTESTCQEIERLLKERIVTGAGDDINYHLQNADVYSTLSMRGCADNSDMYKSLALRELEIVSALSDDELNERETEVIIDTYKKLNMQKQAKEFLNKIQKLTDPAIDFILSMEKIINE